MSPPELQRVREKNPTLELKIISANDVGLINVADKMDIYAVVTVTSDNTQMKHSAKTPIDFHGGSNPTWNHTVKFSVNEEAALLTTLTVRLFSYWLGGENDLYLGEVNVLLQELLAQTNDDKLKLLTYPLEIKGTLSFSYRFKPAVPVNDFHPSLANGQPSNPYPVPPSSGRPVMYSPQFQTTVTKLTLELNIKSAKDLTKVHIGNDMSVYASVMIREGKTKTTTITKTPIAYCLYRNPRWDHEVEISLDEKLVLEGHMTLIVKLIGVRKILDDKDVGEVKVPIQELFRLNPPSLSGGEDDNGMSLVTQGVRVGGKEKGTLSFTYRFLAEQVPQPFIMYPIHETSGYAIVQPRANPGLSNGQLPISMQPQYHQPQPQLQQQQQKPQQLPATQQTELGARPTAKPQGGSNIGALGLGAAIMGRVIGGALLGDMMSDEVNMYEVEA